MADVIAQVPEVTAEQVKAFCKKSREDAVLEVRQLQQESVTGLETIFSQGFATDGDFNWTQKLLYRSAHAQAWREVEAAVLVVNGDAKGSSAVYAAMRTASDIATRGVASTSSPTVNLYRMYLGYAGGRIARLLTKEFV